VVTIVDGVSVVTKVVDVTVVACVVEIPDEVIVGVLSVTVLVVIDVVVETSVVVGVGFLMLALLLWW